MARRAGGVGVLVTTGVHGRVPVGEIAADQMPDLVSTRSPSSAPACCWPTQRPAPRPAPR